jgi:hypothetical protein
MAGGAPVVAVVVARDVVVRADASARRRIRVTVSVAVRVAEERLGRAAVAGARIAVDSAVVHRGVGTRVLGDAGHREGIVDGAERTAAVVALRLIVSARTMRLASTRRDQNRREGKAMHGPEHAWNE